jgi:hypothetical protein
MLRALHLILVCGLAAGAATSYSESTTYWANPIAARNVKGFAHMYPNDNLNFSKSIMDDLLNGTYFSGVFTSHAVLQKGSDTQAAIYGVSVGVQAGAQVTLQVEEEGKPSYTVKAVETGGNLYHGENITWKALLHPHPEQGGKLTISASCSNCANQTAAVITDVTYGDGEYIADEVYSCTIPNFVELVSFASSHTSLGLLRVSGFHVQPVQHENVF